MSGNGENEPVMNQRCSPDEKVTRGFGHGVCSVFKDVIDGSALKHLNQK
jgi:hypothetical protein